MHVVPYRFFNGRCEEAIEFYQRALGADRFGVGWMVSVAGA